MSHDHNIDDITPDARADWPILGQMRAIYVSVAREVALIERSGTKATWELALSVPRLATELTQLLNLVCVLANRYGVDLAAAYES